MSPSILSTGRALLAAGLLAVPTLAATNCSAPAPETSAPGGNSEHFSAIDTYLSSLSADLQDISKQIHDNPELGWQERFAHDLLTTYLEGQDGWNVTRSVKGIETAFMAVFSGSGDGPVVSFNAEYDSLPNIGHACGHNLIATASLGGALGAAEIMRQEKLPGKVILFGTPAEESYGGKVTMLDAGVFSDAKIDVSIMAHPSNGPDSQYMFTQATDRCDIEFYGKTSHAAAAPWQGLNAQDGILLANSCVAFLRQQIRPTDRMHGIITSGGTSINVIPALASGSYQLRAKNQEQLAELTERFVNCFEAGALGTGTQLNFTMRPNGYSDMVNNDLMAASYAAYLSEQGISMPDPSLEKLKEPSGSTDQGNVSYDFPAIHPSFQIYHENGTAPTGAPHTAEFEVAAGSKPSFEKTLQVAKSLAGVAVDVLTVDGLLEKVKEEFSQSVPSAVRRYKYRV